MSENNKKYTPEQLQLAREFVDGYGISLEQISFEAEKLEPIFDFEALCLLREKLTRFHSVDTTRSNFNAETNEAEVICSIINESGRIITCSDFAQIGELMPDGSKVETSMQAKRLARARAMRSAIRQAGVNLLKAHKNYLESGEVLDFRPVDPRISKTKELHVLAEQLGFIVKTNDGIDKTEYQKFIAETYDGRTSSKDLDDIELQRLIITFRAMRRLQKFNQQKAA